MFESSLVTYTDIRYMITRILKSEHDISKYCELYTAITGLPISTEYAHHAKIYGYYQKGILRGGYMINNIIKNECRTIHCFVNQGDRDRLASKLNELNSAIEICCFWLSRRTKDYRKSSMLIWIDMAIRSTIQKCSYIVYGTNVKMLANVYAQPSDSILFHNDFIEGRDTWTFYGKKRSMLMSVIGILKSR